MQSHLPNDLQGMRPNHLPWAEAEPEAEPEGEGKSDMGSSEHLLWGNRVEMKNLASVRAVIRSV